MTVAVPAEGYKLDEPGGVPPPLAEGEILLPGYRVAGHLSRARALDVYDVWSEERGCRCVAKVLRPDRVGDLGDRSRLLGEGRLLERLTHPHIVRAYEVVECPRPAVIVETLSGATVSWLVATRARRLPVTDVVFLGLHMCSAVGYLHRQGMLHLDLKPSNVVSQLTVGKLIDFNLARPPGRLPGPGPLGTRHYMAPEQARVGTMTAATDVWGLGALLYEGTTGRRPFEEDDEQVDYPMLHRRAASVRAWRRTARAFADAVDACLEPQPRHRPTVTELEAALEALA